MNNTVLLKGTGGSTLILFLKLTELWPEAKIDEPKSRWWQSEKRYELRIQNMAADDILVLAESLNHFWPISHFVKMEVF